MPSAQTPSLTINTVYQSFTSVQALIDWLQVWQVGRRGTPAHISINIEWADGSVNQALE